MRLLMQALRGAAASRRVLIASDYDGTLAPIVTDPDRAFPDERAMRALVSLAALADTSVAILSGRELSVLEELSSGPARVELVGSHGAQQGGRLLDIDGQAREGLAAVHRRLVSLVDEFPGSRVETKPAGVAFHFRNVEGKHQPVAEAEARRIGLDFPDLAILAGKRVIEFTGSTLNKGDALLAIRDRHQADLVVFLGDDVTDEDGFAVLRPEDIGVKVGSEATRARFCVDHQAQVAEILEALLAHRGVRSEVCCSDC